MKTIMVASIFGIILFAASAYTSWYLLNQQKMIEAASQQVDEGPLETVEPPPAKDQDPDDPEPLEQLPVALRPKTPMTVDAVLDLSRSIQLREEALLERETLVKKNEKRIQMLFKDLETRHKELVAFEEAIDSKLAAAQDTLDAIKLETSQRDTQRSLLADSSSVSAANDNTDETDDPLADKVEAIREWFSGLKAEQASVYLTELANRGDLELAARLLNTAKQRNIPKILSAIKNKTLEMQLMDELMSMKQ